MRALCLPCTCKRRRRRRKKEDFVSNIIMPTENA
jgi:hypothetical protein